VSSYALLSCGPEGKSKTYPAELIGVDYKAEIKNSRLADLIVQGSFLTGKEHEVILGSGLALRLNARPGDELVLVGNAIDGSLTSELLNVSGIVSTGDQFRDSGLAIMNIDLVQELFLLKKNIHSLRLFLKDPLRTKEVIESLRLADGFEAISWQQSFPQIASLLDLWFGIQIFTMVIYYAALGLITFNTMYMAFIERKFEFAVMRAIGLSKLRLTGLILAESIMIAILSGVIGSLIGTASNFLFFYYPIDFSGFMENIAWGGSIMQIQIYCVPGLVSSLFPFLAMILLGIFVVIFPVCKLYKLHPVEALRDV
jgi:ABC-type lipoprotein release transport system permease subunit